MISFRFPEATPTFIKKALKPFEDADVSELVSIIMTTDALDEFKKRLKASASPRALNRRVELQTF